MGDLLPELATQREYSAIYADTARWLPALRAIARRHGLDPAMLQRQALGTNLVYRTGGTIVKLFCRLWAQDCEAERLALEAVGGLGVPEVLAAGELEGWPYLLLRVVPGVPAAEVWGQLDEQQREGVVRELGGLMRQIHAVPPPSGLKTDWPGFIAARISEALAHHGAGEPWDTWIGKRLVAFAEPAAAAVLLNGDITADHLLLERTGGHWRVGGLIDFGDAKVGHPLYEFVAPLAFYTFGRPSLSRALVEAYGGWRVEEVAEVLTTYCLLHEFGRLRQFLARFPVTDGPGFHRALWGEF